MTAPSIQFFFFSIHRWPNQTWSVVRLLRAVSPADYVFVSTSGAISELPVSQNLLLRQIQRLTQDLVDVDVDVNVDEAVKRTQQEKADLEWHFWQMKANLEAGLFEIRGIFAETTASS
jgi:hypothetical protein